MKFQNWLQVTMINKCIRIQRLLTGGCYLISRQKRTMKMCFNQVIKFMKSNCLRKYWNLGWKLRKDSRLHLRTRWFKAKNSPRIGCYLIKRENRHNLRSKVKKYLNFGQIHLINSWKKLICIKNLLTQIFHVIALILLKKLKKFIDLEKFPNNLWRAPTITLEGIY